MPIRFVYFDLGNVLLTFDHNRALDQLAALSNQPADRFASVIFESGVQIAYETGELDGEQFAAKVNEGAKCSLTPTQILDSCSDIFQLNAPIVAIVSALHTAGYPLGILSNTCQAHWDAIERTRYSVVKDFFGETILSFESKSMKPDKKIYEDAIAKSGVAANEIFFTDDREENVQGAIAAGMQAALFETPSGLIRDLRSRDVRLRL